MALQEKTLRGTMYGSVRPNIDFPRLVDLYLDGRLKIDQLVLKFADDFHKLDTDLHKLDLDVKPLGNDYIKLADAFHQPPGPPEGAGAADSLHQILLHVHDFSLL